MTGSAQIIGVGSSLPDRVVTNDDLTAFVDTSDEWIVSRTGIRSRRFAGDGETASTLAAEAGRRALAAAEVAPEDVDLTVVATVSGDQPLPSTAAFVQSQLGVGGAAFDVAAACAGFIYGLELAGTQIATGHSKLALVVGTEVLSRFLDWEDRTTCVLFGDGAGAVVVRVGSEPGLLRSVLGSDGTAANLLEIPAGGSAHPASSDTVGSTEHVIRMRDGREVFKRAVEEMAGAAVRLLDECGYRADDVSWVVPHQANERIIRAVAHRLGIPSSRVFLDLEEVGNTSAASVPIALDHAWRAGNLAPGSLILTVAFGAGLTWGANLVRWTAPPPETA